jgi:MFS family permease
MTLVGARSLASSDSLAASPSAATVAQTLDAAALAGLPGYQKALASFAVVLLIGGVLLRTSADRVDRSLEALREGPYSAVPYGVGGYAVVLAVGGFSLSQLRRAGVASTLLGRLAAMVIVGVCVSMTAYGFLVVGTLVTEVGGRRRPVRGLFVGAALSAVGWLVLPTVGGLVVWVLTAALGIGGATRRWFHAERTVATERAD